MQPTRSAAQHRPSSIGASSSSSAPLALPQLAVTIDEASRARTEIETVRLISGWLREHGYTRASQTLLDEAGVEVRDAYHLRKTLRTINKCVEDGAWDAALAQLQKSPQLSGNRAVLFALLKQQFLELVDSGDAQKALLHLCKKIKPLESDIARVEFHQLSFALTCKSVAEVPELRGWTVASGRRHLQAYIQVACAPSSTSAVGSPYVHDHALQPIAGELQRMLEDAVAFRHQVAFARMLQQQQQQQQAAGAAAQHCASGGDGIERVTVHSLLRQSVGGLGSVTLTRPLARYSIANLRAHADPLSDPTEAGGGTGSSMQLPPSAAAAAGAAASAPTGASSTATLSPRLAPSAAPLAAACASLSSTMSTALLGDARMPRACCLLPREHLVVVGCTDGSLVAYPLRIVAAASQAAFYAGALLTPKHSSRIWAIAAARAAPRFASIGGTTLMLWAVAAGGGSGGGGGGGGGGIDTQAIIPRISAVAELPHAHEVFSVAMSRDGSLVVTGTKTGDLYLWDAAASYSSASTSAPKMTTPARSVLRSTSADAAPASRLSVLHFDDDPVVDLRLSVAGTIVYVAYKAGVVRVVDLSVGVVVQSFSCDNAAELTSIDLSSNGAFLLCSFKNNSLRMWDVLRGAMLPVRLIGHHSSSVSFVRATFARRDTTVFAGSESGDVVGWDVTAATNTIAVASVDPDGALPPPPSESSSGGSVGGLSPVIPDDGPTPAVATAAIPSHHLDPLVGGRAMLRAITAVPTQQPTLVMALHRKMAFDVAHSPEHGGLLLSCGGDGSIVVCTCDT